MRAVQLSQQLGFLGAASRAPLAVTVYETTTPGA